MADPDEDVVVVERGSAEGDLRVARTAGDLNHFNAIMLDDEEVKKFVRITGVTLVSASVTTDHDAMKDNDTDWQDTGMFYYIPDWADGDATSKPVSHTEKTAVTIEATFTVTPADATEVDGTVSAEASTITLTLSGSGKLKGGKVTLKATSDASALSPSTVAKLTTDLEWTVTDVDRQKTFDAGTSLGHTLYVTFGRPGVPVSWETGSTLKRMKKAVDLIGATGERDPHKIAEKLQKLFTGYTLTAAGGALDKVGHPSYYNKLGNAWCMADYISYGGECQAMVRFMLALMKEVGCLGTVDPVLVWAEEDDAGNVTVKEGVIGSAVGLAGKQTKIIDNVECRATLVDQNPVVGKTYSPVSGSGSYMGINDFEACIRVEHGGKKKYYGGGLQGGRDSPQEVIKCFYALCWAQIDEGSSKTISDDKITIRRIVKRWLDEKGNALP